MSAALAMLCALAPAVPIAPLVKLFKKSDDRAFGTFSASASAAAMSPSVAAIAGSTATTDCGWEANAVLTYAP